MPSFTKVGITTAYWNAINVRGKQTFFMGVTFRARFANELVSR